VATPRLATVRFSAWGWRWGSTWARPTRWPPPPPRSASSSCWDRSGERVHPSAVAYPDSGGYLVGADAKAQRLAGDGTVITSAKRIIGQNFRAPMVQLALAGLPYQVEEGSNQQPVVVVGQRRLTLPEVSAKVLDYLRKRAERQLAAEVTDAVITVPANFTDAQRAATKEAGRLAGLNVLRLINEPTAAALAYGFGKRLDETVCIFDFGGGTFDVSLLRVSGDVFEVLASDGDPFLGGDDLDRTLGRAPGQRDEPHAAGGSTAAPGGDVAARHGRRGDQAAPVRAPRRRGATSTTSRSTVGVMSLPFKLATHAVSSTWSRATSAARSSW
jgi:hypothetical protein